MSNINFYGFIELEYEKLIKLRDDELKKTESRLQSGTFKSLRSKLGVENQIVQAFYKQARELYQEKVNSKMYNAEYLKDEKKSLFKEVKDYADARKEEIRYLIDFTLNEAKENIHKALKLSPTPEQSSYMNMIKDNNHISFEEAIAMADIFKDNYMAMRTYQSIMKDKGFYLYLPKSYDYNEMLNALDFAEIYLNKVLDDFGLENIDSNKTFKHPESNGFYWRIDESKWIDSVYQDRVVNVLDNLFTSIKINMLDINELDEKSKQKFYDFISIKDTDLMIKRLDEIQKNPNDNKLLELINKLPDIKPLNQEQMKTIKNIKKIDDKFEREMKTIEKIDDRIESHKTNE